MKEDWLKDIRGKMTDYETDEPRGLWDDICRARMSDVTTQRTGHKNNVVWLWTKRVSAVAAMVALILSVSYFINENTETPSTSLIAGKTRIADYGKEKNNTNILGKKNIPPVTSIGSRMQVKNLLAEVVSTVPTPTNDIVDTVVTPSADKSVPSTGKQVSENTSDMHRTNQQKRNRGSNLNVYKNDHMAHANINKDKSNRLSFGVFTTGGTGSALNRKATGDAFTLGIGPNESGWEDSPLLGILVYNQGKEVETDIKHRLPVRVGLSFVYKLNEQFSLESGVSYTNLTSDVREGSSSHYFTGEQTLHYIGLPLNVKYKFLSWKGLELYASSGVLAEKCVSNYQKKEYVLDNQIKQTETEHFDVKPFQWSVNASAGLQYNILPSVGIYAEPGVSYYFNDGTSIKTIYKDKPINFNLNLGMRFTFGNK